MPRSRRDVIDGENANWIIREVLEVDPENPPAPEEDYEALDPVPLVWGSHTGEGEPVFWGTGLISFGPVTAAQIAFMAAIDATTDITDFPGDFVAVGWSSTTYGAIEYGIREEFQYVKWAPEPFQTYVGHFTITPGGISFSGQVDSAHYTGYRLDDASYEATSSGFVSLAFATLNPIEGTASADSLVGGDRPEHIQGEGGSDTLVGNIGWDSLEGGAGHDLLIGGAGSDWLIGGNGNDTLQDDGAFNTYDGGAGDDLIDTGALAIDMVSAPLLFVSGGDGFDRVVLDYSSGRAVAPLLPGFSLTSVEALEVIGGAEADLLQGGGGGDLLRGNGGNDVIEAGDGDDTLEGGANGAAGRIVDGAASENLPARLDHMFSLAADPTIENATTVPHVTIERTLPPGPDGPGYPYYSFTAAAGDTVTIDVDATDFAGGSDYDVDVYFAIMDAPNSYIAFSGLSPTPDPGSNYEAAYLSYTFATAGTYMIEFVPFNLSSTESSSFTAHISLTSGAILTGDRLDGGAGNDWADYSSALARVTADLQNPETNHNEAAGDVYVGIENLRGSAHNDLLRGDRFANIIEGADGKDAITGRRGKDTLAGGANRDTLNGGDGADRFHLTSLDQQDADVISDFAPGEDRIVLAGDVFGLNRVKASHFVVGNAAGDANDRLIYDSDVGKLFFDPDGTGAQAKTLIAVLTGAPALNASDFTVI
ncbi:MAG: hypothetical protein H7X93_11505 [Sphingomonadaceae bacterium]|nr:hypothetical protein [Sphingomonadaceae bacterium]